MSHGFRSLGMMGAAVCHTVVIILECKAEVRHTVRVPESCHTVSLYHMFSCRVRHGSLRVTLLLSIHITRHSVARARCGICHTDLLIVRHRPHS